MIYKNPFYVEKIENPKLLPLPENNEEWIYLISEKLFNNYFFKALKRFQLPSLKDYDFTNESIDAYILEENAKMIFTNSFKFNELPKKEIFKKIVEDTKKKLKVYKQNKFS